MEQKDVKYLFRRYVRGNIHPPTYFDNMYEDEWLTNPLSVEMIADVDKSTVIGTHR